MKTTRIFLIFTAIALGSCSNQYAITYDSHPRGANLICGGVNMGYTPKTLYYDNKKNSKEIKPIPCGSRWISGAKKGYSTTFDLVEFPDGVRQTLQRPNVDGYKEDAEFALKVQNMRYQKRQAMAAEKNAKANRDAAYAASRAANATENRAFQEQMNSLKPVPITFGPPSPWRSY